MTKQNANGATEAEKLVEVRLVRDYVPREPQSEEDVALRKEGIFRKVLAGSVLSLPRPEAKDAIAKGIAEITADLV